MMDKVSPVRVQADVRRLASEAGTGVTGVLLVGGASRRFGSPKALAHVGGRTLADRAWEALAWCDERFAVGKAVDALPLSFRVYDDGSSVRAPVAGVVAGLRLASCDVIVALPVDSPLTTPDDLRKLAAACDDVAIPETGPLPGAYHRRTLPVFERRLAEGKLSLRGALETLAVCVVSIEPAALVNVNTKEQLAAIEVLLEGSA